MSEPLSIFDAALDAGGAPALRATDRVYTFADLAELTRVRLPALERDTRTAAPFPLVATNTLDTVVTLYALLEARIPRCSCIRGSPRPNVPRSRPLPRVPAPFPIRSPRQSCTRPAPPASRAPRY
jgi:hypothetical protein